MLHYVGVACEDMGLVTLATLGLAHSAYLSRGQCFISDTQPVTLFLKVLKDRIEKKSMIHIFQSGMNLHSLFTSLS